MDRDHLKHLPDMCVRGVTTLTAVTLLWKPDTGFPKILIEVHYSAPWKKEALSSLSLVFNSLMLRTECETRVTDLE